MSIGMPSNRLRQQSSTPLRFNAALLILKRTTVKLCLASHGHFLKIYREDFTHLYVIRGEGWFWNHWQEDDSDPAGGIHTNLPSDAQAQQFQPQAVIIQCLRWSDGTLAHLLREYD